MVEIKTFNGDFKEVQELISSAWSDEYRSQHNQPVMDYSSIEFLRWNLNRTNIDPDLVIAAYDGSKLVSFVAAMPLNLKYRDQKLKGGVISFFTTHVAYQGKGLAKKLGREGLRRGIKKGYDFGYTITDAGHKAINLVKDISDELGLKHLRLCKFTFLAKPLDKDKITQLADLPFHQRIFLPVITSKHRRASVRASQFNLNRDAPVIKQMIYSANPSDSLSIDWTDKELKCNLKSKLSDTYFLNFKNGKAFINYYNIDVLSAKHPDVVHRNTMIDNVCFENLSFYEKRRFVSDFCRFEKQNGSCSVIIPTLPIFDLKPFYFNLFFPSGRYHHIYGHDFKERFKEPIKIGYLLIR